MKTVLTIAGSDSSGGAGIQADIKTIASHGLYAMSAITALTAQNTMGVSMISETGTECLGAQIDAVCQDIYPDAVKIGMVSSKELIELIAQKCEEYHFSNIVLDPVMVSTSGHVLLKDDAIKALTDRLMPYCDMLTPNLPEAEKLTGMVIKDKDDMSKAGKMLSKQYHTAVLVKAGHAKEHADDLLVEMETQSWFQAPHRNVKNTHGTGCTLSSAIACRLAMGDTKQEAVLHAKEYVTGAMMAGLKLGKGSGPIHHMWQFYPLS